MNIQTYTMLGLALGLCGQPQAEVSRQAFAEVSNAVLHQFEKHDLVALGESHNTQQDQELRTSLVRHRQFPNTVRHIVVECANALHQGTLDRFIAGESVPREDIQRVWRDTTQSPVGGGDSPACEQFLNEIRAINRKLPNRLKLRVLASDPPIDWAKITKPEEFRQFLRTRDQFAAQLVEREILTKKGKGLLIYGAGHLWRNNALNPAPNLASLIDGAHPGRLFTVIRLGGTYPGTPKLESLMPKSRPAFVLLEGTPAGHLDANEFVGRGLPVKLFAAGTAIRQVADACIYSGPETDTPILPNAPDPAYEKEKERRRAFMPRPRP